MVGSVIYSRGREDDGYGRLDNNDDKHDKVSFTSEGSLTSRKQRRRECCCYVIIILVLLFLFIAFLAYVIFDQVKSRSDAKLIMELQARIKADEERLNQTILKQGQMDTDVNRTKGVVNGMQDSLSLLPDEIAKQATSYKARVNQSLTSLQDTMLSQKQRLDAMQTKQISVEQDLGQTKTRLDGLEGKASSEEQRLDQAFTKIQRLDDRATRNRRDITSLLDESRRNRQALDESTANIKRHLNDSIKNTGDEFARYLGELIEDITLYKNTLNQSIGHLNDQLLIEQQKINQTRDDMAAMKQELLENIENATREYAYRVVARTGSDSAADTAADLFLILKGTRDRQCGPFELTKNSQENAEKTTAVVCKYDIGAITGVNIRHSGTDAWEMSWMTITDLFSGASYRISCSSSCWFDDDGHEGGVVTRDLPVDS